MFEEKSGYPIYEISHKYVETPDASSYSRHMHNCCELLLFVRGDANYNIDGILYQPNPYDLLIIPRATYHYFIPVSPLPYENYVLDFDSFIMAPQHAEKLFARPVIINIKDDKEFCRYFKRLDFYHETYSREDFTVCADALLRELLVFCSYRMDQSVILEPERPPLVDTVLRLISDNLECRLDADFLAEELRLSKSYIQNMFSHSMHIGLKQYIMQKKVFAAHSDMMNGMSASAASAKYAFTDYSVFFRLYKKYLGYPPRQTKNQIS
ncbi:MAG: helix-turn-helix transcriptional regulator [Clostridia bacterium]|nr:helix-turn-helix transcriptional regulator [Clostridia bacterium]